MITQKLRRNNTKAHSGTDQACRRGQNQSAGYHPSGIKFPTIYSIHHQDSSFMIVAGCVVRHGAVAGNVLNGGRTC